MFDRSSVFFFIAAGIMAIVVIALVTQVVFPGARAHDGGADSPSRTAHDVMRREWALAGLPGASHWPDGTVSYRIDTNDMPTGWENEIKAAAREMAAGTFIDAIIYSNTSQNIIAMTNTISRRTCSPSATACARTITSPSTGYDEHINSFTIWISANPVQKLGLIENNCQIPDARINERAERRYLKLIMKHEIGHILGHRGHSHDDNSGNPTSDLMGKSHHTRECTDLNNDDKFAINRGYLFTNAAKRAECIASGSSSSLDLSSELNATSPAVTLTGRWNSACPTVSAAPSNFLQNRSTYKTYGKFYRFTLNAVGDYSFTLSRPAAGASGNAAVPPLSGSPIIKRELYMHQGGPYAAVHPGIDGVSSASDIRLPAGSYTLEVAVHGASGVRYDLRITGQVVPPTPTPTPTPRPAASLLPPPSNVAFQPNGQWHRFTVISSASVKVIANPGTTPRRIEMTTAHTGSLCPAEQNDTQTRRNGQSIYLAFCTAGVGTVELRRSSNNALIQTYRFSSGSTSPVISTATTTATSTPRSLITRPGAPSLKMVNPPGVDDTLIATWSSPRQIGGIGRITKYRVRIGRYESSIARGAAFSSPFETTATSHIIYSRGSYVLYAIEVAAYNGQSWGPYSRAIGAVQ